MPRLVLPTTAVRGSFLEAMTEFRLEGRGGPSDDTQLGREEREYGETWKSHEGFSAYVAKLRDDALQETPRPEGWVPATTLWYVEASTFLGRLAIRHRLTPHLFEAGGHIGYDVRPSARRRGHATAMLRDALPIANALGIETALITCDADNIASRKVIEANGGMFADQRGSKLRFWVATRPQRSDDHLPALLADRFGQPTSVESLGGGQSGAAVKRVTIGSTSLVVKRAKPAEAAFYESVAPVLAAAGVSVPECLWSFQEDGLHWIVLEDVPLPLPRDRWLADPAVLGALGRLHGLEPHLPIMPDMYRPAWPDELSAAALDALPAARRGQLKPILERAQEESTPLFEPRHPISGDPNPTNWGIRNDGTVVLFDWERFSVGTAALDLAITIPWLPKEGAYQEVAAAYLAASASGRAAGSRPRPESVPVLARQIALSKVWNVAEYLSVTVLGGIEPSARVESVITAASDWLEKGLGSSLT